MTEFPLPPRQSRIIVEAVLKYPDVVEETVIAAAFLSTQSPYILPPGEETDARQAHHRFRDPGGDFVSYLKLYRAYTASTAKQKFCEKNYLDERAMAEIVNVTEQLEQILSDLEIPVLSGGSVEDYLCAVARGLIQFVCVRMGREIYRSLTADRILIHPGSAMFRTDPEYIVAGEIVRTTRMYAMSVSPLSRRALEKLDPEIFKTFGCLSRKSGGRKAGAEEERPRRPRDFTSHIKIGSEVFEIETVKGRKQVKLPWEKLKRTREDLKAEAASFYKGLRGNVIVDGRYSLLSGEKLSLILRLTPVLEPEKALEEKSPSRKNFNTRENLDELLAELPRLVGVALGKAKKELGFICLFTNGNENYRIKCSRGFHTALNESLASLEALIDDLGDEVDVEKKHIVNQTYRRLSDLLG
jgi:HrpA-like RNA helicase